MGQLRVAVAGAGSFGANHLRVLRELPNVALAGLLDIDTSRREEAAARFECPAFSSLQALHGKADALVVATPTSTHAQMACAAMEMGLHVLVEKPIAPSLEDAARIEECAQRTGMLVQVGHLERFNPAVQALRKAITKPLFFEIHRMSLFSPRSLDVDVILDLMIHDLDIILWLTAQVPKEIRAAGISILSSKVDIANVRLAFPDGCVANLTASRVSTEKIRKIRVFQPTQYLSVDYARQDGSVCTVSPGPNIHFDSLAVTECEPLRAELAHFIDCCVSGTQPLIGIGEATAALRLALLIQDAIDSHAQVVAATLAATPVC